MKKKYWLLSGFSVIVIMVLLVAKIIYTNKVEELVQKEVAQIAKLFPWGEISYEDMDANFNGVVTITHPGVMNLKTGRKIQANLLKINKYDSANSIPQQIEVVIEGLQIPIVPNKNSTDGMIGFTQLGIKQLLVSVKFKYHYDDLSRKVFCVTQLKLDKIADIGLSFQLANIDIEQLKYYWQNPDEILLMKAKFDYTEKNLLSRYIKYQANQKLLQEAEFMEQLNNRLEKIRLEASDKNYHFIADFYETWQQFLQQINPKQQETQLMVSISRTEGLSFRRIKKLINNNIDREMLASLMNFNIVLN